MIAKGSGLGVVIALLGLALFLSPRKAAGIQPVGWHKQLIEHRISLVMEEAEELGLGEEITMPHQLIIAKRGITMPRFPDYPQVNGAGPRLDPTRVDYEEAIAEKYPDELEATRVAYKATRKIIGLRQYTAPPMPRTSRGRR